MVENCRRGSWVTVVRAAVGVAVLHGAAIAGAGPIRPAAAPQPGSELRRADTMLKTWRCTGERADPVDHHRVGSYASTITLTKPKALGGRWIQLTYDRAAAKDGTPGLVVSAMLGFDVVQGKLVLVGVDSDGHRVDMSGGIGGDALSFSGTGWGGADRELRLEHGMTSLDSRDNERHLTLSVQTAHAPGTPGTAEDLAFDSCELGR